jgi:broad specificity phosphatase PhoE
VTAQRPDYRRTDRTDPPLYLARYQQRRERGEVDDGAGAGGDDVPLYLRRFRARNGPAAGPATRAAAAAVDNREHPTSPSATLPLRGASPGEGGLARAPGALPGDGFARTPLVEVGGQAFTREYAATTREKEIVSPPERREVEQVVAEIRIVRHGITQGYSTDAGLTPMGGWQAHQRGHSLSKGVRAGERIRIVCADTNRARQTAEQLYRGMLDGLEQWQRTAEVGAPEPIPELRNFGVWTPDGLRDVTSAFRQYHALMERLERMAVGERPRWLVEIDRFFRTQFGGADPIHMWMTIPLMYFEPPQACVRRFWRGFHRLIQESPDTRIIAATHSGPMRAFATWAHGYDPGEPYNTEEVVVKVRKGGQTALVAYRNRVTEVHVPPPDELPVWEV